MAKKTQWKALPPKTIEMIRCDYLIPTSGDPNRGLYDTYFQDSADINHSIRLIDYLLLAETFLKKIQQSEALPFTIDKSFQGFKVIRENELGRLFYLLHELKNGVGQQPNSFSSLHAFQPFKHYEPSEAEKVIDAISHEFPLQFVTFTRNPESELIEKGPGGSERNPDYYSMQFNPPHIGLTSQLASGKHILEGELINTLVIRLRESLRTNSFIASTNARKASSKVKTDQSVKYIKQLYANNPDLFPIRILLFYNKGFGQISAFESDQHFRLFIKELVSQKKYSGILGWWWKRGFMSETGFHYHIILFYPSSVNRDQIIANYVNQWRILTENNGIGSIPFVYELWNQYHYRHWHPEETVLPHQVEKQSTVITSIKRMFKCEDAWRLKEELNVNEPSYSHFGMSSIVS